MLSYLMWNGVCSMDLGLVIERVPNQNRPARKMDVYNVPGRNGDIIVQQDAWENVEQTYEVWGGDSLKGRATEVGYILSNWLYGASGYQVLEDSYDPGHYRLAYFAGGFDFESLYSRRGRAQITFSCDPRRFLTSGKSWVTLPTPGSSGLEIINPTAFPAKPIFDITIPSGGISNLIVESESGVLTKLTISKSGHFIIDCEKERITENGDPAFNSTWGKFPTLYPGVSWLNPQHDGKVQPNWWEL